MADRPSLRAPEPQSILFILGFLILAGVGAATLWLVQRTEEGTTQILRGSTLRRDLSDVLLFVRRAESGQRGFLLTNDTRYLTAYDETASKISETLARLKDLTAGSARQIQDLNALAPDVSAKMEELRATIDLQRQGRATEALELVDTDIGLDLMARITANIERMIVDEERFLAARAASLQRSSIALLAVTLTGAVGLVTLAGASVLLVRRSQRAVQASRQALLDANQGLEGAVAERTIDLREANQEIQRFAYVVSHDLRSPLVNIMGFTGEIGALRSEIFGRIAALRTADSPEEEKANDERLENEVVEALSYIRTSITKMDRLINAILLLSRQGARPFKPEPVDMTRLIGAISDSMAHQTSAANAEIVVGPLPSVHADRLALEQIFSNLLDNAIKYLRNDRPGRIVIAGSEASGRVAYQVRDNGRGVDQKDKERIFEMFRRAGALDRPGEGIGLAHVRTLIRRLEGSIRLESEPGQGSTFTVTLPKTWTGRGG